MYFPRQVATGPMPTPANMDNHGKHILAVTGFFTGFACFVVLARLYVRIVILKMVSIDDYVMSLAVLCSASIFGFFVAEVKAGVGEHISNPQLMENYMLITKLGYFSSWIMVTGISCVKISIGFFLLRLVQGKWFKRFITAWITFLVIFTLASVGTLVFQCVPVTAAWTIERSGAKCYSIATFRAIGLFNGSINIFTDFVFATLPIPIIIPLRINRRTKISLIANLSLGYFACASAIVKEVLLSTFFQSNDNLFNDAFNIWNDVELNTGILAACLPALRPLFNALLETASSITTSSRLRGHSNPLSSSNNRHHYILEDGIKLSRIPARSTLGRPGYGVIVESRGPLLSEDERIMYANMSATSGGSMSRLEKSIREDSVSEENSFSLQHISEMHRVHIRQDLRRGILRTTEVTVSR